MFSFIKVRDNKLIKKWEVMKMTKTQEHIETVEDILNKATNYFNDLLSFMEEMVSPYTLISGYGSKELEEICRQDGVQVIKKSEFINELKRLTNIGIISQIEAYFRLNLDGVISAGYITDENVISAYKSFYYATDLNSSNEYDIEKMQRRIKSYSQAEMLEIGLGEIKKQQNQLLTYYLSRFEQQFDYIKKTGTELINAFEESKDR